MTEDEMVGSHHQLNGHESEQALGNGEGQGSLACCSPQGHKESDTAEKPKNNKIIIEEMQTKITMRCPLTPVRMVILRKSTSNKC